MMRLISGKRINGIKEAVALAVREAGVPGMTEGIANLFNWVTDGSVERDAWTVVGRVMNKEHGKNTSWWEEKLWCIGIPHLRYDRKPTPSLQFEVERYIVAETSVRSSGRPRPVAVVGAYGKPESAILPLSFLLGVIEDDLAQFRVTGKAGQWTLWEIVGMKKSPLKLHDAFLKALSDSLEAKPVDRWLADFGHQSQGLVRLVVSDLLFLLDQKKGGHLIQKKVGCTRSDLEARLREMGYSADEAGKMIERTPDLRADDSEDEALVRILRQSYKGG
jgi:hypothetical protein